MSGAPSKCLLWFNGQKFDHCTCYGALGVNHDIPHTSLRAGRFHGVLAPNAKLRSEIIPSPVEQATEPACDHAQAQGAPARMSWARLLKRVFDIDIDHCPNCGGSLKIIAAIEDPPVIVRILTHLGLPTPAPGAASRFIPDNLRAENRL